jgi:crotonobetainyl-CoA:carnitine CoA-transferase CaiB-like acyl-CoA transferase
LSATPPAIERPAPTVGQHSEEILSEFGIDATAIADLKARKVIEQAA